jgi:Transposase IS116/IS110/IS902 family
VTPLSGGRRPSTGVNQTTTNHQYHNHKVAKTIGAHPRRSQSSETDHDGRIWGFGDAIMRTALYEAVQVLLPRTQEWSGLKAWAGMQVARRRGGKKAIIALARRLAVILHRMWRPLAPTLERSKSLARRSPPSIWWRLRLELRRQGAAAMVDCRTVQKGRGARSTAWEDCAVGRAFGFHAV